MRIVGDLADNALVDQIYVGVMLSLYALFPHIEEKALLRLLSLKRWAEPKSLEQKELTSFPIWNSMRGSALERSIIIHFGLRRKTKKIMIKIEAETDPDNQPSMNVLAKVVFIPNGETGEEGPRFVLAKKRTHI